MDTLAGPKSARDGDWPSSCQLIVADWPAVNVVEAVGEVVW